MNAKQKKKILIIIGGGILTAIAAILIVAILLTVNGSDEERQEQRYVMQGTNSHSVSEGQTSLASPTSEAESETSEADESTASSEIVSETNSQGQSVQVESISLSVYEITLEVGHSQMPIVTMSPENATDKSEIWESSNESVATVNSQGRITGVAPGECTVTVTSASNPGVQERVDVTIVTTQSPSSAGSSSSNSGASSSSGSGQTSSSGSTGSDSGSSDGGLIVDNGITDAMIADFNARAPHIIELAYEKLASIDCSPCRDYIDVEQNPNEYAFQSLPDADTYLCNWADSCSYTYDWTDDQYAEYLVEEVLTTRRLFGISVTGAQFEYLGAYYSDSTLGISYDDGYPRFRVLCFDQYK